MTGTIAAIYLTAGVLWLGAALAGDSAAGGGDQGTVHRYTVLLWGAPSTTVRPSGARAGSSPAMFRKAVLKRVPVPEPVTFQVNTVSRESSVIAGFPLTLLS